MAFLPRTSYTPHMTAVRGFCGLILASGALISHPVFGASARSPDGLFFLHTGTPGGACKVRTGRHGVKSITCVDESNLAEYRVESGCGKSKGSGYCGRGVEWAGLAGAQLNCPSGVSYSLSTGVAADTTCAVKGKTKSCETSDGTGSAKASCSVGCYYTAGGGSCCAVGTAGCP